MRDDLFPAIEGVLQHFKEKSSIENFAMNKAGKTYFLDGLKPSEKDLLCSQLDKLEVVDLQSIKAVLDDLQAQAILSCLYETLDLVGILETHCGRDVVEDDNLRQRAIKPRYWRSVFAHASKFPFK